MATHTAHAGWSEPVRISEHGGFGNPQILARGDTLHVVYEDANVYSKIGYQRSTDAGVTWEPERVLTDGTEPALFPKLIQSGSRLMALWTKVLTGYYRFTVAFAVSTDHGQSWGAPRHALNPGTPWNLYFGASAGSGLNIDVVYDTELEDSLAFYSVRSTDFGQNWSTPHLIFRAVQSGLPDQAGYADMVHFVWAGRFNFTQKYEVRYIRSTDDGQSWSDNYVLSDSDQFHSQLPSISADSNSGLGIAWMDYKYSPYPGTGDIFCRLSVDSGLTWAPETQAPSAHFSWDSDITLNTDTVHIVWADERAGIANKSIYYTRSNDAGFIWEEPYWIDGTLDNSWDPALAISNGRVYVVWGDGTYNPDTTSHWGLYFSRWDPEPDAIEEGEDNLPKEAGLLVYPNPFNSSVSITYTSLKGGDLRIFDLKGALVKSFSLNASGEGKITWDATDASGKKVCSGTYFARAGEDDSSRGVRLIYLK